VNYSRNKPCSTSLEREREREREREGQLLRGFNHWVFVGMYVEML